MKSNTFAGPLCLVVVAACGIGFAANLSAPTVAPPGNWRTLSAPHYIWPNDGAIYYSFSLPNGSRAHLIVLDTRSPRWQIRPAISEGSTSPTSVTALKENASAAVNGGYFNLKDGGLSASYVVINGTVVADPTKNDKLMHNPHLLSFLPQVLNRSELRILEHRSGHRKIQIAHHDAPLPEGTHLVHSLQAGPRLLPAMDAEGEAFLRRNADGTVVDAISVNKPAARTAFGITPDGYAMILCVADKRQDQESAGVTLDELATLLKSLGCAEAINFDGGASTTMFVRLCQQGVDQQANRQAAGTVVVGRTPETLVKSILMLEPRPKMAR